MPREVTDPRAIAAIQIHRVIINKGSVGEQLRQDCKPLAARDAALVKELCYGTLRFLPTLAGCLDQLLKKPLRRKDLDIYALLLLGCYQLRYMRTPDHAAVASTVAVCPLFNKIWAKQLVNGVLRQFQKRQDNLFEMLTWWQLAAHPQWLAEQIKTEWSQQFQSIFEANNSRPPMFLRLNLRLTTVEKYLELLTTAGINASASQYSRCGVLLESAVDVSELPGFADGWVSVQDEAAQLAAPLLELVAGQRVLDVCAAPGGKTAHILEIQPELDLLALDIDESRNQRTQENLSRLQLSAQLKTADACKTSSWWDGNYFDRILLDAPCSATGVIRRHPDIKSLRLATDVIALTKLQSKILDAIWPTLKSGGLLVYATCSVLAQENEKQIGRFIECQADAEIQALTAPWGLNTSLGRQLLPVSGGHDGFYYACLRKRAITDS